MRITSEFIQQLKEQRNLQSCINNSAILAQCIRELQGMMEAVKLRLGLPDKANEEK